MIKDLTGEKFNRLKVLKFAYKKNGRGYWECQCDCGNITFVRSDSLQNGAIKSCGCLHNEISGNRFRKHGLCKTKIYKKWEGMKARCLNPNNTRYKDYGGRNITICQEWLDDFMNFYNWAINNGYKDGLTIERINNDGNYEPSNCKWITKEEQMKNTRNCHYIEYNGETHCVSEWLKILGITSRSIANKLYKGYPIEKLFNRKYTEY